MTGPGEIVAVPNTSPEVIPAGATVTGPGDTVGVPKASALAMPVGETVWGDPPDALASSSRAWVPPRVLEAPPQVTVAVPPP